MKIIAKIHTDFKEKFGIPRQSGIATETVGKIVFEPEYRVPEALRGIEEYSHLWLVWNFSESERKSWSPTVRPPRLGGNKRMGVFATRSPFRPNPIGLSSVKLLAVEDSPEGKVLIVAGADILDGTPIYDIKPYLAFTDSHPDAICGFADGVKEYSVEVLIPDELKRGLSDGYISALCSILSGDPRPSYKEDGDRIYGMVYGDYEVKFTVSDGVLSVCEIIKTPSKK